MIDMHRSCLSSAAIDDISLEQDKGYCPLVETQPLPQCEVCVIVPVRNEATLLESCLSALANQVNWVGQPIDAKSYEVILLANNCDDNSAAIAHDFAHRHPKFKLHIVERTLPPSEAYIGRVRQLLMDEAYRRLKKLGSISPLR